MLQGVGPQAQPVMLPDMSSRLVQLEESTSMLMSGAPLPADMQRAHACTKVCLSASANYAHAGLLHVVPALAFTIHRRSNIAAVCAFEPAVQSEHACTSAAAKVWTDIPSSNTTQA